MLGPFSRSGLLEDCIQVQTLLELEFLARGVVEFVLALRPGYLSLHLLCLDSLDYPVVSFFLCLVDFVLDTLGFRVVLGEHFVQILGGRGEAVLDLHFHLLCSLDIIDRNLLSPPLTFDSYPFLFKT